MSGNSNEFYDVMISHYAASQPARVPLLRACRNGAIQYRELTRYDHAPDAFLNSLPAVVILTDADAHPTGPMGWNALEWLQRSAGFALVCATDPPEEAYAACANFANTYGLVCIVETDQMQRDAWIAAFQPKGISVLAVNFPPDPQHPLNQPARARH